jgi:hypothetical protein
MREVGDAISDGRISAPKRRQGFTDDDELSFNCPAEEFIRQVIVKLLAICDPSNSIRCLPSVP